MNQNLKLDLAEQQNSKEKKKTQECITRTIEVEQTPLPSIIRQETLYWMFSKMQPKEFEGSMDPLEPKDCLHLTQMVLEAMELGDREKIIRIFSH